jgi:hypothetical protein
LCGSMIDFVNTQAARPAGLAICKCIEPRTEDHALTHAPFYCLGHAFFRIAASQNHVGAQSSSQGVMRVRRIRLNLLERIRVKQAAAIGSSRILGSPSRNW